MKWIENLGGVWFVKIFSIFILYFHFLKIIFIFKFQKFRKYVWIVLRLNLFSKIENNENMLVSKL